MKTSLIALAALAAAASQSVGPGRAAMGYVAAPRRPVSAHADKARLEAAAAKRARRAARRAGGRL